jgi:hypothetical protein
VRQVQPSVAASQRHVMSFAGLSSSTVNTMIRITGIGDHNQPDWLITINGMRSDAEVTADSPARHPGHIAHA